VVAVAGRDAGRAPAAARPLLGAGSTYWLLLAVVCALLVIGLVMVLSASSVAALARQGDSYAYFKRQLLWVVGGVVVMLVTSRIDYRRWRRLGTPLLIAATAGLVYVLAHPGAVSAYGSTRWIAIGGGLTVQPAEFAKLALLLFSADVLTRKSRLLGDVRHLLVPVLPLTLLLAALVMLEPDLGTTLLLCAIAFGMLFVAGAPLLLLGGVGTLGLAAGMGLIMSAPYRRTRFLSFMDPAADPQNGGYQFIQGRLALGSGGLLGVGLGAGRQKWSYVPNAHTDFIFAIIGEELGLLGTLSILLLFVAFAYAGVRVAQRAPDPFGRYLAGGVTVWIVVQALVNIGAVVGVLPITGVPLPLVSFGGSSMLVLLAATGMLLNVARHEVWSVRRSVMATTTRTAAERRGRRTAARPPSRPARGRPASVRTTTHGGGHPQTPAQKAKADAERARRTQGSPPTRTPRKEPR
jgi:cell division protein FtsW